MRLGSPRRWSVDHEILHIQALASFLVRKTEMDAILGRPSALSSEHFNVLPDAVTWGDVGTLGSYLQRLRAISNEAFQEGEHAA